MSDATKKQPFTILENGFWIHYESRNEWLEKSLYKGFGTNMEPKVYLDSQLLTGRAHFDNQLDHDKFWGRKRINAEIARHEFAKES